MKWNTIKSPAWLLIILSFYSCGNISEEKRNLATPLSRLWGHWVYVETPGSGGHLYFSKVTSPEELGQMISVNPDKAEIIEWANKNRKAGKMPKENYDIIINSVDQDAGKAQYARYKFISQVPNGEKILIWDDQLSMYTYEYNVDKDGKTLRKVAVLIDSGKTRIQNKSPIVLKYVDMKTSPEE